MKKIFILPILIAPIIAHATDPVGPAHVNSGAVVATANPPYAIAEILPGDNTTVVSASYVKGAYNDTIAAVNLVWQGINDLTTQVDNIEENLTTFETEMSGDYNNLVTNLNNKRINAVTTWGNDTSTQLELSSLPAQP